MQADNKNSLRFYGLAILGTALATCIGLALDPVFDLQPIDQIMIFLMGCVIVASRFGRGPAIAYSLLSANSFNFFFIEPLHSFVMYERSYWTSLIVMLVTSYVIADQAERLRQQAISALKHDHDTQSFYELTRMLAATRGYTNIAQAAAQHIEKYFAASVTIWLADSHDAAQLVPIIGQDTLHDEATHMPGMPATGTRQYSDVHASSLHISFVTNTGRKGMLGVRRNDNRLGFSTEDISMLETFANLLASSFERASAAERAEKAMVLAEKEKLRNALLSSVSHDLRTPLASIIGSSSSIIADSQTLPRTIVAELAGGIHREANRLSRIVSNLLDVTRLESGNLQLNLQPYFIEELIGAALTHAKPLLAKHHLVTKAQDHLPMVTVDGTLIEQVLVNIFANASRYAPHGTTVTITATTVEDGIKVTIADEGPGIQPGEEKNIFDKFYTSDKNKHGRGTGLGLAVCHGIITAHQGKIWAHNQPQGGACFSFILPLATEQKGDIDGSNASNHSGH